MKDELIIINHIGTSEIEAVVNELMTLVEEVKETTGKATILAFGSRKAIDKLKEEHIEIDYIDDLILRENGKHSVITIMPTHLIGGNDYQRVKQFVDRVGNELDTGKNCSYIEVKKPFLTNYENLKQLAMTIHKRIPKGDKHVLFVGHGTSDESKMYYDNFIQTYRKFDNDSSFMDLYTPIKDILVNIPERIALVPLFTASGHHVKVDLFEGEQSVYKQLKEAGKEVFIYSESLLAQKDVRKIYINSL
jgi:Cobalamin biosynthesis protein CbiK, Co2+ chelatase